MALLAGVGRLHEDLGALLFGGGDKEVAVTRPALHAQVIDGKTDLGIFCIGQGAAAGQRQHGGHEGCTDDLVHYVSPCWILLRTFFTTGVAASYINGYGVAASAPRHGISRPVPCRRPSPAGPRWRGKFPATAWHCRSRAAAIPARGGPVRRHRPACRSGPHSGRRGWCRPCA